MLELVAELEALSKRPTSRQRRLCSGGGSPFLWCSFSWAIGTVLISKPSCIPDLCLTPVLRRCPGSH